MGGTSLALHAKPLVILTGSNAKLFPALRLTGSPECCLLRLSLLDKIFKSDFDKHIFFFGSQVSNSGGCFNLN